MPLSAFSRPLGVLAFTAAGLLASTSLAAEFHPDSRIDAVTVFPAGAEVERIASLQIGQGAHEIVFDGLPDGIRADDVRVEGSSDATLVIQSVDVARVPVTGDPAAENALRGEREDLVDRKAVFEGRIRTAEIQRRMIAALAQPVANGDAKQAALAMPPEELFAFIAERHAQIEDAILAARKQIRETDRRIAEIDRELSRGNGKRDWATRVRVHVDARGAGEASLKLRYRHARASWQPVYDARLDTQAAANGLTITQRAAVTQRTGEDWAGVKLSLATTRPSGATAAPEADVRYVGFAHPEPQRRNASYSLFERDGAAMAPAPAAEEPQEMRKELAEDTAQIRDLGFDALYSVPGLARIPATGDAKLVRIGDWDADARMEGRIVPARHAAAYLTVRFTHSAETPLPEGPVRLFRDGIYIGQGHLPLAMNGDETELGFGQDERIAVTRQLVSSRDGEEGIFSRAKTNVTDWRTRIVNHHGVPIDIVVLESLPQAMDERITVKPLAATDPADDLNVDGKPGVLAWRFALEPDSERTLSFGYRIDWPDGQVIRLGRR